MPTLTVSVLVTQGLATCACLLHQYIELLSSLTPDGGQVSTTAPQRQESSALRQVLKKGEAILHLLESANESFGTLIFNECALSLVLSTLSSYVALSATMDILVAPNKMCASFMLASQVMIAVLSSYRIYFIIMRGQGVTDEIASVVKALRTLSLQEHINDNESRRVSTLKEEFTEFGSMKPEKMYSLNAPVALSALSAVITYLVVLLQFKTGQSS